MIVVEINADRASIIYNSYSLLMSKKKLSKVIILGDSAYLLSYLESEKLPSLTRTSLLT